MSEISLICVRHGNTFESDERPVWVGRQSDMPLTAYGRKQIEKVGQELRAKQLRVDAVFHGSLVRQSESAAILADMLADEQVPRTVCDALDEIDYGAWEGLHTDEVKQGWSREYSDWLEGVVWPESVFQENYRERLLRLSNWLKELRESFPDGGCVLATSSNGALRLLNYFDRSRWQQITEQRDGATLKVSTGGYCEVKLSQSGLKVLQWNCKPDGSQPL